MGHVRGVHIDLGFASVVVACAVAPSAAAQAQAQIDDLWFSRTGIGGVIGQRPDGTIFASFSIGPDAIGVTALGADRVAVTRATLPAHLTVYDPTGAVVTDFALPEVAWSCGDLARFADGTFAVCDTSGDVDLYSPSGAHVATFDAPTIEFPLFAWMDVHDRLWIGDVGAIYVPGGRILCFDRAGLVVHDFPVAFEPGDVVVEPSGEIWTTNRLTDAIVHLDASGAVLAVFPTGLGGTLSGLAMATDGTLWTNSETWAIARHFGRDGSWLGEFVIPLGVGRAYMVDVVRRTQMPESYCTAGTTTHGCRATLSASGHPSVSLASGFVVAASGVEGARNGMLFYSATGAQALAWATASTSYLCVLQPIQRTLVQGSGGASDSCEGGIAVDLCDFAAANPGAFGQPFAPGERLWVQAWFRDPGAPRNTNLSDALVFDWMP